MPRIELAAYLPVLSLQSFGTANDNENLLTGSAHGISARNEK